MRYAIPLLALLFLAACDEWGPVYDPPTLSGFYIGTVLEEDARVTVFMRLSESSGGEVSGTGRIETVTIEFDTLISTLDYAGEHNHPRIVLDEVDSDGTFTGTVSDDGSSIAGLSDGTGGFGGIEPGTQISLDISH
jgi:hypothetical protein